MRRKIHAGSFLVLGFSWGLLFGAPGAARADSGLQAAAQPVSTVADDAQALFEKARRYFHDKDYRKSKELLSQLVAKHPMENFIPQARLLLADLQENFSASIAQFKGLAIEYGGRPEGAEAQKELGARYYLADKYQEAAEAYREFLREYPKNPALSEARYWYASSLMALDRNQEAAEQFEKALQEAPDGPWAPKALLGKGNALFKMKRYGDAERQYLRILDRYHLYEEINLVYFRLGQTYEAEGKTREALGAYRSLVEGYPKSLEAPEARARMAALEPRLPETIPTPPFQLGLEPPIPPVPSPSLSLPTPTPGPSVLEAAPEDLKPFHVQVGVFSRRGNAEKAEAAMRQAGFEPFVLEVHPENLPYPYFKVRVGRFADRTGAEKAARAVRAKTRKKAIVVEDE
jgi:TolA-binding protein